MVCFQFGHDEHTFGVPLHRCAKLVHIEWFQCQFGLMSPTTDVCVQAAFAWQIGHAADVAIVGEHFRFTTLRIPRKDETIRSI